MEQVANFVQEKNAKMREDAMENRGNQNHAAPGICTRCGKLGHLPDAYHDLIKCERCDKEGHVARVCYEKMPWDFISPFFDFLLMCKVFISLRALQMMMASKTCQIPL